ncbi:MAG: hypothetical protein EA394_08860 [Bacteroidia bacterium]|nr:MAG: hypothetical protein EA394_08860 [Bacteroidia bacterium]
MERFIKFFILSGFFMFTGSFVFSALEREITADTLNLKEAVVEENDTIEYELIIFDPRFSHWYVRESRPIGHYNQSYLERWNKILTDQWNQLYHTSRRRDCVPEVYLEYDPDIDYGMKFNHQLFYYFKYMHERCRLFRSKPGGW